MKECSFDKKYTDNAPVAMAYVPWQHFKMCENPVFRRSTRKIP